MTAFLKRTPAERDALGSEGVAALQVPAADVDTVLAVVLAADIAADSPARRLTRAEAAEVRSLIIDSGYTRTEALAWVRELGVGVGQ